jgi:hypothetical protein
MEALAPLFEGGEWQGLEGVPIHPMYTRDKWNMAAGKHTAPYPIRRVKPGYWEVCSIVVLHQILTLLI